MTWSKPPGPGRSRLLDMLARPNRTARLAGLVVGIPAVLSLMAGIALTAVAQQPELGCPSACNVQGWLGLETIASGAVGVVLAIAIWRRHIVAIAVAICISTTAAALLLVISTAVWSVPAPFHDSTSAWATLGAIVVTIILCAALASEALARARAASVRAVPVTTAEAPLSRRAP